MTQLIVLISVSEATPGFSEDLSEPSNSLVAKQKWTQEKETERDLDVPVRWGTIVEIS